MLSHFQNVDSKPSFILFPAVEELWNFNILLPLALRNVLVSRIVPAFCCDSAFKREGDNWGKFETFPKSFWNWYDLGQFKAVWNILFYTQDLVMSTMNEPTTLALCHWASFSFQSFPASHFNHLLGICVLLKTTLSKPKIWSLIPEFIIIV